MTDAGDVNADVDDVKTDSGDGKTVQDTHEKLYIFFKPLEQNIHTMFVSSQQKSR